MNFIKKLKTSSSKMLLAFSLQSFGFMNPIQTDGVQKSKYHEGLIYEEKAWQWLLENSTPGARRLIARNARYKMGELDLVFEEYCSKTRRLTLVVCEVRVRRGGAWVDGLQSVSLVKMQRLRRAFSLFLLKYKSQQGRATHVRGDVMAWNGFTWQWIPHAWSGEG